jgi:hypothetical protein
MLRPSAVHVSRSSSAAFNTLTQELGWRRSINRQSAYRNRQRCDAAP